MRQTEGGGGRKKSGEGVGRRPKKLHDRLNFLFIKCKARFSG